MNSLLYDLDRFAAQRAIPPAIERAITTDGGNPVAEAIAYCRKMQRLRRTILKMIIGILVSVMVIYLWMYPAPILKVILGNYVLLLLLPFWGGSGLVLGALCLLFDAALLIGEWRASKGSGILAVARQLQLDLLAFKAYVFWSQPWSDFIYMSLQEMRAAAFETAVKQAVVILQAENRGVSAVVARKRLQDMMAVFNRTLGMPTTLNPIFNAAKARLERQGTTQTA